MQFLVLPSDKRTSLEEDKVDDYIEQMSPKVLEQYIRIGRTDTGIVFVEKEQFEEEVFELFQTKAFHRTCAEVFGERYITTGYVPEYHNPVIYTIYGMTTLIPYSSYYDNALNEIWYLWDKYNASSLHRQTTETQIYALMRDGVVVSDWYIKKSDVRDLQDKEALPSDIIQSVVYCNA